MTIPPMRPLAVVGHDLKAVGYALPGAEPISGLAAYHRQMAEEKASVCINSAGLGISVKVPERKMLHMNKIICHTE